MDLEPEVNASSVGAALTGLSAALDRVIEVVERGGLDELGVMGLVNAVQGFERVRNRMALIDHRIVGDCERRQVADELNLRTTQALLINVLRLSSLDAGRRVRAAASVGARTSMVGEPMEPLRPVLADAQRQGEVTPEQVAAAEESLRDMEGLDAAPDTVTAAERTLVEYARVFDPRQLSRVGEKLADIAAPDGKAPDDSVLQLKRRFAMATGRDGAVRGKFCLTPDVGAALAAVLSPLAKPRLDPPVDGGHLADAHKDSRTHEQRMHDALGDLCGWALRGGGLATPASTTPAATDAEPEKAHAQAATAEDPAPPPTRPGPPAAPATVIVTIDIDDLLNRTGRGETSFGTSLSPEQILRLAGEADIYPTVVTATGVPLHLGRTRRLASRAQSIALIARDGGCSFPGCDHPPEWCDKHHITAWIDGGPTDLDNLTLLCRYHHTRFLGRGWTCHINTDGVPAWTPPRWQDPTQTPLVHLRILRRHLERQIERAQTVRSGGEGSRPTADSPRPSSSTKGVPNPSDSATGAPHASGSTRGDSTTTTPAQGGPTIARPTRGGPTIARPTQGGPTISPSTQGGPTISPSTQDAPTSTTPATCVPTAQSSSGSGSLCNAREGSQTWLDVVAADLRRAQIAREAVLSAAAEERGRRLGALWCPDEDDDLNAHSWTPEEIWEAGWRPADPHPERLARPWEG